MSRDYYYFVAGLPNISFEDNKLSVDTATFREEAQTQLSDADLNLLHLLHLPQDLDNLLKVIYKTGKDFDPEGLHDAEYWESYLTWLKQALENPRLDKPARFGMLPDFITEIVSRAFTREELPSADSLEIELIKAFYGWACSHSNGFIAQWFSHEAEIRNILLAISGRKYNLPYAQYLVGDTETADNLAKSHAADFGLGKEHELYEALIRIYEQNNILYRERSYDILRWKWIDNQNFFNYFNIDRILGYYSKLRILSRWVKADPELGKEIFHDTLNALENSFSFPEDFNIKSSIKH